MRGDKSNKDVQVSTDLPPQVDGQLRCFCKLSIPRIVWPISKSPAVTYVRVKWWGEDGRGTIFRPLDIRKGRNSETQATARYSVRSGPIQFATYLKDMSSLTLDVLENPKSNPIGQAIVSGLDQLSTTKGIQRKLPVMSMTGQKIADLDVSLVLEHLMASYDCNGTIPTSDLNSSRQQKSDRHLAGAAQSSDHSSTIAPVSVNGYYGSKKVMNHTNSTNDAVAITANGDVVSLPMNSGQRITADNSMAPMSHGVLPSSNTGSSGGRDLLSMLVDRGKVLRDAMAVSAMHTDQDTKHSNPSNEFTMDPALLNSPTMPMDVSLLPKSVTASPKAAMNMLIGSPPVKKQDFQLYKFVTEGSPGTSLSSDFGLDHVMSEVEDPNHDNSLLQDLFYNESDIDTAQVASGGIPFHSYLHQHLSGLSPGYLNIPSSAMEFPAGVPPAVAVEAPGNQRPPSRASSLASLNMEDSEGSREHSATGKKKKGKRKARSRSRSLSNSRSRSRSRSVTPSRPSEMKSRRDESKENSSIISKDGSAINNSSNLQKPKKKVKARSSRARDRLLSGKKKSRSKERDLTSASEASFVSESLSMKSNVDGLSVERLTLLGRVQVARVNIDILNLNKSNVWDLSSFFSDHLPAGRSKRSSKSKKPCAFFVEYQFPIVASSKDKYTPNAIATEVTRVASRNIKSGAVSFGHRSMYPVIFDGSVLDRWWKSALVFRLFAREAGQNSPSLIGSGGISLKSILKSDNLFIKREVEIPDSNHDGLLNSSRSSINTTLNSRSSRSGVTIFGHLKISVELASDNKEFATVMARTKLSEMSGNTKMVPMGGAQSDKARLVKQLNKNKDMPVVKSPVKKIDLPFDQEDSISRNSNNPGIVGLPPQSPRRKCLGLATMADSRTASQEVEGEDEIGMLKKQLKGLIGTMSVAAESSQNNCAAHDSSVAPAAEAPTLHCLLYIEEGRNMSINGIPPLHMANQQPALMQRQIDGNRTLSRNSYLACRMFWCSDVLHSQVCWNSLNPEFNFLQVSPVSLNSSLLEKMKDNYMIVEVWDKQTARTSDKLVGLVKLSLHQFYLSFRDRKIGNALLKSQYPVMAVDNYMPIIDLFSGLYFGQLKVVLAMGSQQQISMLQQAVVTGMQNNGKLSSTPRQDGVNHTFPDQGQVDHHFDIVVEGVRGLKVFEKMIWGEADCFVQFYFPSQGEIRDDGQGANAKSLTRMKCFRTATTLCIPDPVFHDSTQIKLTLPVGKPVQPELLIACSNPGEQGKGLPFEVWCRYYHPNVRDQRIAQGILPIAKLCAMVTMHKPSQPCVQSFPIHLSQVMTNDGPKNLSQGKNTGLMDVAIRYSNQTAQGEPALPRSHANTKVSLTVEIIRAAGLKAAAECVAQSDPSMLFCADVGVNSYIRVKLPFLGKENEKMTKTIAKSFIPEFSQCMNFLCDVALSDNTTSSHTRSLAEIFETSEAVFEIWHQTTGQGYNGMAGEISMDSPMRSGGDVLLGSCNVPLVSLLTHFSGVHGWFPITQPQLSWTKPNKDGGPSPKNQVLGGIELSLRFTDASERERVVSVGRGLGWSPLHMDSALDVLFDEGSSRSSYRMNISVEMASFPLMSAVRAGHSDLDVSSLCYVCYKVFDQGVTVSKSRKIHNSESGALQSHIGYKNEFHLPYSADLQRYLQEKRLEIQVWVTHSDGDKSEQRPRKGDRLIGSCYIELDSLLDKRKKKQQISGSFPMFNGNSPSLKSAFVRANIVSTIQHSSHGQISDEEGSILDTDQISDSDSTLTLQEGICVEKSPKKKRKGRRSGDIEASFLVVLALERAMHLPMVSERNRSSEVRPTTYVSYQSAEKSGASYTSIFPNSCNPLWDYAMETRLSNEYLHKQNKNLVLKVWHKPSDASKSPDKSSDRVLGFVSVDLSPIAKGLNQLCGWYNIIDFTGQCRGQIKVSITPQDLQTSGGVSDTNTSAFGASTLFTPPVSLTNTQTAASTIAQQLLQLQQHVMARMGSLSKNIAGDETASTAAVSFNNNYQYLDTSEEMTTTTGTLSTNHPTPRSYNHNHHQTLFSNRSGIEPESTPRDDSSKSFLFSTLRRQLADLDKVMEGFKERTGGTASSTKMTTSQYQNVHHGLHDGDSHEKSGDVIYGSHSELSTIRTASSLMNTRESSAPSRINNNSSSDVITSQEMQGNNNTSDDKGVNIEVPGVGSSVGKGGGSLPKLSDSGVFSSKYCAEDGGKSEEGLESGRTEKNLMMMTTSDNQSTLQSVFDGGNGMLTPSAVLEEDEVLQIHSADMTEKTQPFVLNASNSESSQNSQGFALQKSGNNKNNIRGGVYNVSPSKSDSTLKSVSVVGAVKKNGYLANEGSRSSGSKSHLELLDGEVSDDESEEEDKMFGSYHRYRDLLDAEEEDEDDELRNNDEGNDTVEIVPRNLNMSPLLHDGEVGEVNETPVINSGVCNGRYVNSVYGVMPTGARDLESQTPVEVAEEASPSRNVHEGTSVWYTEGSEEDDAVENEKDDKKEEEETNRFEEVFERNQRLLIERDEGEESDDNIGDWMAVEKEVLGNQNVEEWLVHRSHETDNDDNDNWLRYRNDVGSARGDNSNGGIKSDQKEQEFENDTERSLVGRNQERRGDEMKLFLDEVSDHEDNNDGMSEEERRRQELNDESSDEEDTPRNEDDSKVRNNASYNDVDSFFNVEPEGASKDAVSGFLNSQVEDRDSIEILQQQSEALLQSLEDRETDFHSAVLAVTDDQPTTPQFNNTTGQGARPKIRHMLSNVDLDSETSNSGSRRNSKGSGTSMASRNGYDHNVYSKPVSDHHGIDGGEIRDLEKEMKSFSINDSNRVNGYNSADINGDIEVDSYDNQVLGNSLPLSRDGSEEIVEEIEAEDDLDGVKGESSEERVVERRYLKGHNSTSDSAFVDGECSEGHTTGVNSSAMTGGHVSYVDDSGLDPSANSSCMLAQGQGTMSNGDGIGNSGIPNFFMNTEEMQGSISALQKATAAANSVTQKEAKHRNKVKAVSDLVQKITDSKSRTKPSSASLAKAKPPPSSDHTKRIAKIFSSKPT